MIFNSLHVKSTQIKQSEECVRKRQTKTTIRIQKIENRFDESLIYEFFEISFISLSRRLRVS